MRALVTGLFILLCSFTAFARDYSVATGCPKASLPGSMAGFVALASDSEADGSGLVSPAPWLTKGSTGDGRSTESYPTSTTQQIYVMRGTLQAASCSSPQPLRRWTDVTPKN
jgi:hypothetical protein